MTYSTLAGYYRSKVCSKQMMCKALIISMKYFIPIEIAMFMKTVMTINPSMEFSRFILFLLRTYDGKSLSSCFPIFLIITKLSLDSCLVPVASLKKLSSRIVTLS